VPPSVNRSPATAATLAKTLRPPSLATGNAHGCGSFSRNLLSSGQLDLCGTDHWASSNGSGGQGSWSGHQRHLLSIRCSPMKDNGYAGIRSGKSIPKSSMFFVLYSMFCVIYGFCHQTPSYRPRQRDSVSLILHACASRSPEARDSSEGI
jgi:hypothetical protein